MTQSIICTLFESHYHYGLAALVNSLHQQGFRGAIFAGYRGDTPAWAGAAKENKLLDWPQAKTIEITSDFQLHLLPVTTDYHLTNYKPDFMLELWDGPAKGADAIYYFDPDIVITAKWLLYENWVACGIALCEDVNSPLASHHPRRVAWRKYFGEKGFQLQFKDSIYVNGGFVGVHRTNKAFLEVWKSVQEAMALAIGGLNRSAFKGKNEEAVLSADAQSPFSPFGRTDQDALNAAVETWSGDISLLGQEAMGFKPGPAIMLHALGQPKPWQVKPITSMMKGRAPRNVDREYWNNSLGVVQAHSPREIKQRKMLTLLAAAVSRFYRSK